MKILTVLHSHGYGGAENHALQLMLGLRERGHEPVYAGPADGWLSTQAARAGLACHHLPMHGFFDAWSMTRLAWLARRERADLIHGHLTRGAHYAGIASRLSGVPALATAHSTNAGKHFGRARRVIAVSQATRDFLIGEGYAAGRINVVHNGVADPLAAPDAPREPGLRATLGIAQEAVVFGMVARFVRDKGHDFALEALARLPTPAQLVLIGDPSTAWGAQMCELATALALDSQVHWAGFREGASRAMREFDVLLAPSRREALSLTLVEAAAAGVPVLASHVGGNPEAVIDGETGLLVPAGDVAALAAAMQRLAESGDLRRRLGQNARQRYLEHFSLGHMLDRTEAVYRQVLQEARP